MATKSKRPTSREQMAKMQRDIEALSAELAERRSAADLRSPVHAANDPMMFGALAQSLVAGLPLREFAIKATIGFIYGYTLGVVGSSIIAAMALLALPAWITFVFSVLIGMALIYVALGTVIPVTNFTYNTFAKIGNFVKKESLAAREWVEKTAHELKHEHSVRTAEREARHVTVN